MRAAVACAALAAAACSSARVVDIDLRDETGIEFLAIIGSSGEVTRVTPLFRMDGGRVTFGKLPSFQLEEHESSLLLVRIPDLALPRGTRVDLVRTQLAVELADPTDPPAIRTSTLAGVYTWAGALPIETEIFDVTTGEKMPALGDEPRTREVRARTTLRAPIDLEHCRAPGDRELGRWGDLEPPNAPCPLMLQGVRGVVPDGEHVLLVTRASLTWIARNASVSTCGDDAAYLAFGLRGPGWFAGGAIDRSVEPRRFVVAGNFEPGGGAIFDVEIRGGGPVITSSIAVPDLLMFDIAASKAGDGKFAISADTLAEPSEGIALFVERDRTSGRLRITDRFVQERGTPRNDEKRPVVSVAGGWLILRASAIHRWMNGVWSVVNIEVDQAGFYAMAARQLANGEVEMWVSSERGVIYYRSADNAPWETFNIERAPPFLECTIEAREGGREFNKRVEDLDIAGGHLFAAIGYCRAIAQVALDDVGYDDTCVAFSAASDQSEPFGAFRSMVRLGFGEGELISAAEDGRIRAARLDVE